jgi:hypothetical protein
MSLQVITTSEEYNKAALSAGWNVILCNDDLRDEYQEVKTKLIAMAQSYQHVKFYIVDTAVKHMDSGEFKKSPTVFLRHSGSRPVIYNNGTADVKLVGVDMSPIEELIKRK